MTTDMTSKAMSNSTPYLASFLVAVSGVRNPMNFFPIVGCTALACILKPSRYSYICCHEALFERIKGKCSLYLPELY